MSVAMVLVPLALSLGGAIISITEDLKDKDSCGNDLDLKVGSNVCYQVETPIKRMNLLQNTLEEYQYNYEVNNGEIVVKTDEGNIRFIQNQGSGVNAIFEGNYNVNIVTEVANEVFEQYTSVLQSYVYKRLIEKTKEKGYELESETVQEDMSIVLDFVVNK